MYKKAIPFVLVSGLVLTGCNTNNNVPKNNETPMEAIDRDTRDLTPRVNNGAGPDMDGINNGNGVNNGVNDGRIINNGNRINGDMNGDGTTSPNNGILTDENTTTPNGTINRDRNNNR
ncbi:hypothetical protein [Sporosarcina highlanderae]|uniref:Lipoprotein n=1 Tax=Sporosarcina highlanderae TaxID=3035916 RepID=A0ABT8JLF9_9BACL|nr:hypothetical protein [Sporosarcina highlanderae]MDN4605978.1 hypothetical protein [Sporosarcina highlanderae]